VHTASRVHIAIAKHCSRVYGSIVSVHTASRAIKVAVIFQK